LPTILLQQAVSGPRGQALRHAQLRHRPPRRLLLCGTWPAESEKV